MSKLRDAADAWVRAEYLFRCGPDCYSSATAKWFEMANDELRRALTGESDLERAATVTGVAVAPMKKKKPRLRLKLEPVQMEMF
jgi:hypothetical protein